MSDKTEQMIKDKGLTAPRVTPEHIQSVIGKVLYKRMTEVLTICVIHTKNGFTVTGESACASPENFDALIGQDIAYKNAKDKIWVLEGYLLKEKLYLNTQIKDLKGASEGLANLP